MSYTFIDDDIPQKESTSDLIGRTALRTSARSAETFLGSPGDIANLPATLSNLAVRKVMGEPPRPLPTNMQEVAQPPEDSMTNAQRYFNAFAQEESSIIPGGGMLYGLPTSQELRGITKELTGEYLEPRSELERIGDEFTSDLVALLSPAAIGSKALSLPRAITTAATGNLAKWLTKTVGGSETAQTGAKLGTMLLTSLVNPGGLERHMKNLYNNSRRVAPEDVFVSTHDLIPAAEKITKLKKFGFTTPTKKVLDETLQELLSKIDNEKISIKDLVESKVDLNELVAQRGLTKTAQHHFMDLKDSIKDVLQKAALKNPSLDKIVTSLFQADDIYQAINQSSKLKSFLNKHINIERFSSPATAVFLGLHPKGGVKGALGGFAAKGAVNFLEPIIRSSNVRKYYGGVVSAAIKNNATAMMHNVNKLDRELSKQTPINQNESAFTFIGD